MSDTQNPMVQPPAPGGRWWSFPLAAIGLLALVAVAVAGLVPSEAFTDKSVVDLDGAGTHREATPFARVPASAEPVGRRVSFGQLPDTAEQYPSDNDFLFVTISEPPQTALSWFVGRGEESIVFITEIEKYGQATPSERRQRSRQMMATSEQIAQYVALEAAGYDAELVPGEVIVDQLLCLEVAADGECTRPAPADEVLDAGDVLLSAGGTKLDTLDDLQRSLASRRPGDVIEVELRRGESERTVDVELVGDPDDPGRTLVGFVPVDTARVELPFEIDIDTGAIGGPSAGLAFTLSLLDQLTPGDLAPDDVAVTGTIGVEGTVGAIGGLPQKVEAVKMTGVDVFLVPASQGDLEEAMAVAGDEIALIPVTDLDEALAALERLGGDPVAASD
ncbi:MAG: PDZ domain-containing protein [Actinomycetota bacterium]|nr:PDZ domain-containing protein [Actinomycetota bacterium]